MPSTTSRTVAHGPTIDNATIIDLSPWRLADLMHRLVEVTLEPDHEVAAVLAKCREAFRVISANRQADEQTRRSRARVLRRRHQTRQKGQNHA